MKRTLAILGFLLAGLLLITGCGDDGKAAKSTGNANSPDSSASVAGSCDYEKDGSEAARKVTLPPGDLPEGAATSVALDTNVGQIRIELEAKQAPCTVNNFLSLAQQGYFDGTNCHRLVDNAPGQTDGTLFVLQCGDPTGTGRGGPGYSFADELIQDDPRVQPCEDFQESMVCTYTKGTVAMANAGPNTNGSQFFLVFSNSRLPNAYTVFGHMDAAGVKVVQQVAKGGFNPADPNTPPNTRTIINKVEGANSQ
ncbi:MAG TPA: peptidylprolyl isomerase [Marmoricola sp.]|nr:peptidylprolyl isomerase [Marmoricola sp.]